MRTNPYAAHTALLEHRHTAHGTCLPAVCPLGREDPLQAHIIS